MYRILFTLALCLIASEVPAQETIVGEWDGYWFRAGDSLAVTLHVERDPDAGTLTATFDSRQLRVLGIPFSEIQVEGCCSVTMRLQGDRTTAVFTGRIRGDTLAGELSEGATEGRFAYTRKHAPTAPLVEREITFENDTVTLAGSLILPAGGNGHPAVVFVHGSGAEGRWASRFLATTFAEQGFAALIFDKRGVGSSTGDWRTATLEDLAGDAAAAIAYLRGVEEIDAGRVGIHGHSQGGTLVPLFAARSSGVAFLIASAAAGIPTDSTEIFSILNFVYPNAPTAADSADALAYVSELVDVAYHGGARDGLDALASRYGGRPWFFDPPEPEASYWSFSREFGDYQPLLWWRRVRVPVLLLYGAEDKRVPPHLSAARIADEVIRHAPGADVTVRIFPGADHAFRLPPGAGGWPSTVEGYLATLLNWLDAHHLARCRGPH